MKIKYTKKYIPLNLRFHYFVNKNKRMVLRSGRQRRLLSHPYINRSRRLTRIDTNPNYLETIIIHSDSSDEEKRLDDEIDALRERMDELDEEKSRLRRDMAKKFKERESVRVARQIKKNNLRLKRELEHRLLPTIESIAARRQDIIHGVRDLFENIDDHPDQLPPTYESLYPRSPPTIPGFPRISTPTSTSTNTRDVGTTSNGNDSDSSTTLPSVDDIFESLKNN